LPAYWSGWAKMNNLIVRWRYLC